MGLWCSKNVLFTVWQLLPLQGKLTRKVFFGWCASCEVVITLSGHKLASYLLVTHKLFKSILILWALVELHEVYWAILCCFWLFFKFESPQLLQCFWMVFCCDAPEMVCGLQNWFSICMWVSRHWQNFICRWIYPFMFVLWIRVFDKVASKCKAFLTSWSSKLLSCSVRVRFSKQSKVSAA